MKKLFVLPLLAIALNALAQKEPFASSINEQFLKQHLGIIAGAEMEGRETGTEGQRKAASYIQDNFFKWGLKHPETMNGYQQLYELFTDSLVSYKLVAGNDTAIFGKDYIIPNNRSIATNVFTNGIVFAGYGIAADAYNDYAGLDVSGKAVVILTGEPKKNGEYFISGTTKSSDWTFPGIEKKAALAYSKGANAVFFISAYSDSFNTQSTRNAIKTNQYFPSARNKPTDYALLTHNYAARIFGENMLSFIKRGRNNELFSKADHLSLPKSVSYSFLKNRVTTMASNVIGVVEGSTLKDEYIYVSAHYDHLGIRNGVIYYGADDDGSGTVAVMAMAQAFAKAKAAGTGPKRTLVFLTLSGEEKGLWGSDYFAEHPVYPLDKITANLNIDMIGRTDTERKSADTTNYVYVVGESRLSKGLKPLLLKVNKGHNMVLDPRFDDPKDPNRIFFRSDHYSFARKGVPALFFYDGMLKSDYHKPTDTVDKIAWALYRKRTALIYSLAWELANAPKMLSRDIPLSSETR